MLCASWACLGMVCIDSETTAPGLPEAKLKDIRLQLMDPETGRTGALLAWEWTEEKVSSFEVYQSFFKDSLGTAAMILSGESRSALVRLPDSGTPFTLYYGVRAVLVEATGQKRFGRSVPVDSLKVNPSLEILSPTPRSRQSGRNLEVDVRVDSDDGIVLRQTVFEHSGSAWSRTLDTCLPKSECGVPTFGNAFKRDELTLQSVAPGDTLETLYCVQGDETFEDLSTGRSQSLGCVRFFRIMGP